MANDALPSETAEKVRARIRRPVSRQHICLDRRSEGRSAAVWRSHVCVDRIAAGEIGFFSGLVDKRYFAAVSRESSRHARGGSAVRARRPGASQHQQRTSVRGAAPALAP